jgi:preprotein translocase subunit SecF
MKVPNPYEGNYKILIAIPLLLVVASLFFIPQIKKGVDFKGGTLVTMQSDHPVDEQLLASELAARGFGVSSAKSMQNPAGYEIEVEIERDEKLTRAEDLKTAFFAKIDEASRLEADVTATNQSAESIQKYMEGRKEVDETANGLFEIAGLPKNASSYPSTNELKQVVGINYRKILDDSSEKLAASLTELVKYQSAQFNEVSASLSAKFLDKAIAVVIYSTIFVSIVV